MLVSIGMPLYNEEKYLIQALDSLLAQNFKDFEIIVSDNASTDGTGAIIREYAQRDPRIKYFRNEKNIGGARNFNRCFKLASGKYFVWASGHDLWDKNFLTACVQVLDNEERVVLAYPLVNKIDQNNRSLGLMAGRLDTRSLNPLASFNVFIWALKNGNPFYGLMRAAVVRQTRLLQDVLGTDVVFLAELVLLGELALIDKPLFYRRETRPAENTSKATSRRVEDSYVQKKGLKSRLPWWDFYGKELAVMGRAKLDWPRKIALLLSGFTGLTIVNMLALVRDLKRLFKY